MSAKRWFSFTAYRDRCLRRSFSAAGLTSTTYDLRDGTVVHCWVPKSMDHSKPSLILIHGIGANAMWQWNDFVTRLSRYFNLFVPDLVFFGQSHTTRPERSESFQARCVMGMMDAYGVSKVNVAGLSYGGFVAYSMAAQFPERVDKVVLCCAGVAMEERDLEEGMFKTRSVEEAVSVLLPLTPDKIRELVKLTFAKPVKFLPTFFLNDFIAVMCIEYRQEKKELIQALHKDRKLSNLPKITQPTKLIWGEQDLIFPLELAHRLNRHPEEKAQLVVIRNAGHALNAEKPKEMYKNIKSFLIDPMTPSKQENHTNNNKMDLIKRSSLTEKWATLFVFIIIIMSIGMIVSLSTTLVKRSL